MDRKIVSISSKRQVTIPQKYFKMFGFGTEAEFVVKGSELIIRPAASGGGGEFAEQILADLIKEGYSGEKLLAQFKSRQSAIRPAVEKLIDEAHKAALGQSDFSTYDEIFGSEEE